MRPPPSHQILLAANGAKDASVRTVVVDFFTAFNTIKAECIRCSTHANSSRHLLYIFTVTLNMTKASWHKKPISPMLQGGKIKILTQVGSGHI